MSLYDRDPGYRDEIEVGDRVRIHPDAPEYATDRYGEVERLEWSKGATIRQFAFVRLDQSCHLRRFMASGLTKVHNGEGGFIARKL